MFFDSGETQRTTSLKGNCSRRKIGETHPCRRTGGRTPSREGNFIATIIVLFLIAALPSCKPDNLKEGAVKEYFDIEGYFEKKVAQLKKQHHTVTKTVVHNGTSESKNVEITNWDTELALFIESDINKPAWNGSYAKQDSAGAIIYTAKDTELRTRRIVICKAENGSIRQISIYNQVNNLLYNTHETLNYYPDSAYVIEKYQKVKLLGANTYKITGKFN